MDFPENIIDALKAGLGTVAEFTGGVLERPLRPTDPNFSCGVYPIDWDPRDWQIGQQDPAITRYNIQIQTLVKHAVEESGIVEHSRLAKHVRVMLFRNAPLRVQLGQLQTNEAGVIERTSRWSVNGQRFLSNELNGTFIYLAVTEMWLETEIV